MLRWVDFQRITICSRDRKSREGWWSRIYVIIGSFDYIIQVIFSFVDAVEQLQIEGKWDYARDDTNY